jgi:hypothetical protein
MFVCGKHRKVSKKIQRQAAHDITEIIDIPHPSPQGQAPALKTRGQWGQGLLGDRVWGGWGMSSRLMTSGERCGKIIDQWAINGEHMDYQ